MINIFSVHAKRTDFLRPHLEHLNLFCGDKFQYYCIDNFKDTQKSDLIKTQCFELGVNYVRFNNYEITGTAADHSLALNSIKNIADDKDINVILEFDVFLINHFSFSNFIGSYNISGVYQQRSDFDKEYLAPFVVIVNKDSNFSTIDFGFGDSCDVGGNTRFYLENKEVKWMEHTSALEGETDKSSFTLDYNPAFGVQIIENSFLHYYRGTNWDNKSNDYESLKTEWLETALKEAKTRDIINYDHVEKYHTKTSHAFRYWNGSNQKFNSKLNVY